MDQKFGVNLAFYYFKNHLNRNISFLQRTYCIFLRFFCLEEYNLFSIVNFFGQPQFFAVYLTSSLGGEIQCQCFTCSQASTAKSNKLRNSPKTHKGSSQLAMADNFPFLFLMFSLIDYLQPFFSIVNFVRGYVPLFLWVTLISQISL